jgi:redox-sensing transcriptional repressor
VVPSIHSKEVPLDKIPSPSKKRLVLLERLLSEYKGNLITSKKIEELSSWSAAVIRKDISLLGVHCGASNGYKVAELLQAIRKSAGLEKGKRKCCIVGLGRIGQSLLGSTELDGTDFELVAGFDSNVNRTEILHADFPLHPTTLLEKVVREEEIKFAILTVSASEAQQCAAKLSDAGIIGIVNYTPCVLSVPPSTAVENVSLLTALETLSAVSEQV